MELKPLDGLSLDEVCDIFGEPSGTKVTYVTAAAERTTIPNVPKYLLFSPQQFDFEHLSSQVCIKNFGEAFDIATETKLLTRRPRTYYAPEAIFDKEMGIAGDLWAFGSLLFETRMEIKIIDPPNSFAPSDEEYILHTTIILGKLPDRWWKSWNNRSKFFQETDKGTHSRLVTQPGLVIYESKSGHQEPRSILDKIRESCCKITLKEHYRFQDISEAEAYAMADLLTQLLQYVPERRLGAQDAINHEWFLF